MALPLKIFFVLFGGMLIFGGAVQASALQTTAPAASASVADMPEYKMFSAPETGLPVRIKPGKPQVVHLEADAGRVIVDDQPKNVSAVIYDARSITLFPHSPTGGAHFTVFGKDGKVLMARYAIIGDPDKKYIRLHEVCNAGQNGACEKTSVYFCPNLCYETRLIGAVASQSLTSK